MSARTSTPVSLERAWWLRAVLVLTGPRAVFAALRDDSAPQARARQEPVLAILLLAGIAGVLSTTLAETLLDSSDFDGLVLAVWAFVGGALYGATAYVLVGALLFLGANLAGSLQSYRRARHVLAFAAAPLALSLAVWPVRLAAYGGDSFRTGGADEGAGNAAFEAIEVAFLVWTAALLALGVRTVEGWTWPRTLAALVLPLAVPAAALARAYGAI